MQSFESEAYSLKLCGIESLPALSNSISWAGEIKLLIIRRFFALKGEALSINFEEIFSHSSGVKSHRQRSTIAWVTIRTFEESAERSFAGKRNLPLSSRVFLYSPVSKFNLHPSLKRKDFKILQRLKLLNTFHSTQNIPLFTTFSHLTIILIHFFLKSTTKTDENKKNAVQKQFSHR